MSNVTKMEFIIAKGHTYYRGGSYYEKVVLECKGNGTEENPVIIDSSKKLPEDFFIQNSKLHVILRNFTAKKVTLFNVQNAKFEECNIRGLILFNSNDNKIINSTFKWNLNFKDSNNNYIENSSIKKIRLDKSNHNRFKNCEILKIKFIQSQKNSFNP